MPMLAEVNTSRPPIEKDALGILDPEGDRIRLGVVVETVQQNRELVAAEAGQRVAMTQARLRAPARRRAISSSSPIWPRLSLTILKRSRSR